MFHVQCHHIFRINEIKKYIYVHMYKVVQIWPGLFVCKQVTACPGHIWTTLYVCMYFMYVCTYIPMHICFCVCMHVDTSNAGKTYNKSVSPIYACCFSHVKSVQCLFHSSTHWCLHCMQKHVAKFMLHAAVFAENKFVMKPECSFCCSEQSTFCHYPQPHATSWWHFYPILRCTFNIMLQSTPKYH
jgi:hypothetical protein